MKKQTPGFRHLRPILETLEERSSPTDLGGTMLSLPIAGVPLGLDPVERIPRYLVTRPDHADNDGGEKTASTDRGVVESESTTKTEVQEPIKRPPYSPEQVPTLEGDLFSAFSINTELGGSQPKSSRNAGTGAEDPISNSGGGSGQGAAATDLALDRQSSAGEGSLRQRSGDGLDANSVPQQQGGTSVKPSANQKTPSTSSSVAAPVPLLAVGPDAGRIPLVKVYDARTQQLAFSYLADSARYRGGVRVAVADVNGDGQDDVITGTGNRLRVMDGQTRRFISGKLGSFQAFTTAQSNGVYVAAGDVNGDGKADLIAGTEAGGAGLVRIFSGANGALLRQIQAEADAIGGLRVASGDLTGDGIADVITAAGPGARPRVCVYDGVSGALVQDYFAADQGYQGGLQVTAGDLDGDGRAEVIIGTGGDAPEFQVYGHDSTSRARFSLDPMEYSGGVRVGITDANGDGKADIAAGTGQGDGLVRIFGGESQIELANFSPYGAHNTRGLFVAGAAKYEESGGFTTLMTLPEVSFSVIVPVTVEGSGASFPGEPAVIRVSRTGDTSSSLNVSFTVGGTAQSFVDYNNTYMGGAIIGKGQSYWDIPIFPIDDALIEGDETVVFTLSASVNYTIGSSGSGTLVIKDNDGPSQVIPDKECECGEGIDVVAKAPGLAVSVHGETAGGVRAADGIVCLTSEDLSSSGFEEWGQVRSWTNDPGIKSNNANGNGWVTAQLPYLLRDSAGTIAQVSNGNTARLFDNVSGTLTPRHHLKETLTLASGRYTLTDTEGNKLVFFDFGFMTPTAKQGKLEKRIDASGNETIVSYDGSNRPSEIQQQSTIGGTTVTESYLYAYVASGTNAGKVESVTLRRKVNAGSWSTVRVEEYSYYGTSESNGNAGDLKLAVTKDASGNALDTRYYRYYTSASSTGYVGGLKYEFGPESYGQLVAAYSTPDSATDAQVDDYADRYLEYGPGRRVTQEVIQGAGCSSCTGGLGTTTVAYTTSGFASGYNSWRTKTVTTLPDGTERSVYTNYAGQVMLDVTKIGSDEWAVFTRYDSNGRVILRANASAVSGYDETKADLLDNVSGNYTHLRDGEGLIQTTTYATTTTATSSTPGDVAGYLKQTAIQRGETGTSVAQSATQYLSRTAGSLTIYVTANETRYRNDNGTGGQTTSYDYVWRSGTVQAEQITTTLPTVSTGQNGPNTAVTSTVAMDVYGRVIWSKDGAGFLSYTEYDQATGGVVKVITDVDTTQTSDFANLPSGWSTPSGGGLHLISTFEVDHLGRTTKATDANGNVTYTVYNDSNHEVRIYRGWDSSSNVPTGPTEVYREDRAGGYTESLTTSATPAVSGGRPTGTESIGNLQTLSRSYTNGAGQVTHSDAYFNLSGLTHSTSTSLGTVNTHFYRTEYGYDWRGRQSMVKSPTGTIQRTVYDGLDRVVSSWVGTDDTGWTQTDPSGGGATGNNMTKVAEYEYDEGGVGDGNLTQQTLFPGGSAADRVTTNWFDWRNRVVATKSGVETSESTALNRQLAYVEYDNLNQVIAQEQYDGDGVTLTDGNSDGVPDKPSSSLRRARSTTSYDEQGRVYLTEVFSVNASDGSLSSDSLKSETWYDLRGQVIKSSSPGGLVSKQSYDGAGRLTKSYVSDGGGDTGWSDADDVTGDVVLEQMEYGYDDGSNVLVVTTRRRFHDETGTGELGTPTSGVKARVSYVGSYYDQANRLTDVVDVGTNGGSAWSRPSTVPSRSDTILVTSQEYNSAGWVETTTDPRGIVSKSYYDNLGRTTKTIEAYVDGVVSDSDDKTVEYTYNGSGQMTSLKALLAGGAYQTTEWVYGVSTSTGSDVTSNDLLGAMKYPDKSTGNPSSSEQETYTVNALGEVKTKTDRNGTVHTYSFDVVGRAISDAVTTLGSGVDGAIRRLETAYDTAGRAYLFTSYDASSGGNVVNQVQREFNGLGQLTKEYQAVNGAVNTGTTPYVGYTYSEMAGGANHSRLTSMTYPNGKVLNYNYAGGLDNAISRLSSLSDTSGTLESYDYLGLGTVVRRAHPQPGVDLTFIKQGSESNGDAGDQYTGLDRFDRVVDQRWIKTSDGSHTDRFQYGYDRNSNRLYRENLVDATFSELYEYDLLNQLTGFERGTLNGTKDAIVGTPSRSQSWDFDALGNFESQTTDGVAQTRDHNEQNQITSISGLTTPTYDANGNLTGDEQGNTLIYDAWNRLVEVNDGSTPLAEYSHDALKRRVTEGSRTLYYSAEWQVIEERESGLAVVQNVFSPVYVDAIVLRDRDTDSNGTLDERLWAQQDANFNVTAVLNGSGAVQERYVYDSYGTPSILTASWAARTASLYGWVNLHQGGRWSGVTGLYHFRNRELSATLGRWMQLDSIGFDAGDVNLYRTIENRPTVALDPNGKKIYVHAFEGAGGFVGTRWPFNIHDPVRSVMKRYVESGAKKAKQELVWNYYAWTGTGRAIFTIAYQWATRNNCDRFVVLGYSWGAASAVTFVNSLTEKIDLGFTVDPVKRILPLADVSSDAKVWINYYQRVDTKTLPKAAKLLYNTPGIQGGKISGSKNVEVKRDNFKNDEFIGAQMRTITGVDPDYGHVWIAYYKNMLLALESAIAALK